MTSDAKIGLLLGLIFIFIIAFIINGLPKFSEGTTNNELTTSMVSLHNEPPGIGAKERKVSREVINQGTRFEMILPKRAPVVKETIEIKQPVAPVLRKPVIAEESRAGMPESVKPNLPKFYVVCEGNTLSAIAKKFYGSQDGNKIVNITRIFKANPKLKSPDEICVGQKLVVPSLTASSPGKNKIGSISSGTIFEKIESIGKRHLSVRSRKARQKRHYIVREGDSLWRISAEQLGDGSRYGEIAKLNADIIDDEDSLNVGMHLKLPAR